MTKIYGGNNKGLEKHICLIHVNWLRAKSWK